VRKSAPSPFGLGYFIPLGGVVAYVGLYWISFTGPRRLLIGSALFGSLVGLALVVYQAVGIGVLCWMCVVVDVLALMVGACALALAKATDEQVDPLRSWAWILLLALALLAPTIRTKVEPEAPLPQAIAELYQPETLNVVEFVDIQCPHCRRLHPVLKAEISRLSQPVNVHRYYIPLAFHPLAEDAARAAICGHTLGKGERLAELLLEHRLAPEVWFEHAKTLGLSRAQLDACMKSQQTTATLAEHRALYDATGAHSLPLTFIGQQRIKGAPDPVFIVRAFDAALKSPPLSIPGWAFTLGVFAAAALIALAGYRRSTPSAQSST
jgi:predicted DsbA family dithiol-disulfide isomerase